MSRPIVQGAAMVAALAIGFVAARWWIEPARPGRQSAALIPGSAEHLDEAGAGGGAQRRAGARRPKLALITPVRVQSEWDAYVLSDPEHHVGQDSEIIQALVRAGDDWIPSYMECADLLTGDSARAPLRVELRVGLTADAIEVESGRVLSSESGAAIDTLAQQCFDAALPRALRIERDRPARIAPYRGPFEMLLPSRF